MAILKLKPFCVETLWGGTRLKTEYGIQYSGSKLAEAWMLSCHPSGPSYIENGKYAGYSLSEYIHREGVGVLGDFGMLFPQFPILIKYIDAKEDLSVQVHPPNLYALEHEGQFGKTEMWYIVDCQPQSALYLGFSRRVTPEEFLRRAGDGSVCEILNRVPVSPGDVFYILPGTIHAIGSGILIAEIQQNSNTTFRVYDYQRRDQKGNLRPLHLRRAAEVINYTPIVPAECKANNVASFSQFTMQEMFSCGYFRAYRIDVHPRISLTCDGRTFHHILCVEGCGTIDFQGSSYPFGRGESFLMPAAMGEYQINGACRVLLSRV